MIQIVKQAVNHLALLENETEYPLYLYDRDEIHRLSHAAEWTDKDKRSGLFLFAKYRRVLIRDGFDYYKIFPKSKHNHDLEERTTRVYRHLDYLVKHHHVKPPRGADLMILESLEEWVKNKIIEVRILNAKRNGNAAASR
jgi:hypothetical protein